MTATTEISYDVVVTLSKNQFHGYLFHGTENAENILSEKEVSPSSDESIAGASGVYTSTRPSGARAWGRDVVALRTSRPLRIHPDIESDPELSQMRRQHQFAQEYFSGEPDLGEYYGPSYGDKFPLTEESAKTSVDVSEHLQKLGYEGHIDTMAAGSPREKHVVVYDPSTLIPVKKLKKR